MMKRLLYGWSWMRAVYLLLGLAIVVQSAIGHEWLFMFFGLYFAAMGAFGFGCAAGVCIPEYRNSPAEEPNQE